VRAEPDEFARESSCRQATALHEWQLNAIAEGIAAADRGEVTEFSQVRAVWEKKLEARLP